MCERIKFPTSVVNKIYKKSRGLCCGYNGVTCPHKGEKLQKGEFQIEHHLRLADGGTNDMRNLRVMCTHCHKNKSREEVSLSAHKKRVAEKRFDLINRHRGKKYYDNDGDAIMIDVWIM